jgi:hypothetical protein
VKTFPPENRHVIKVQSGIEAPPHQIRETLLTQASLIGGTLPAVETGAHGNPRHAHSGFADFYTIRRRRKKRSSFFQKWAGPARGYIGRTKSEQRLFEDFTPGKLVH